MQWKRTSLLAACLLMALGPAMAQGRPPLEVYQAAWRVAHDARDRGDCKAAVRLFTKAMSYSKQWPPGSRRHSLGSFSGHFYRGMCYRRLGQYQRALLDLNAAVAGRDYGQEDGWLTYHERGLALLGLGRYRKALADFSAAIREPTTSGRFWAAKIRLNPRIGEPYVRRCQVLLKLGKAGAARADCRRGISAYQRRCQSMADEGRPPTQVAACRSAIRTHPEVRAARELLRRPNAQ